MVLENIRQMAVEIMQLHYQKTNRNLDLNELTSSQRYYIRDTEYTLTYLLNAIRVKNASLFLNYMKWLGQLMKSIKISKKDMIEHLWMIEGYLSNKMSNEEDFLISLIEQGIKQFEIGYHEIKKHHLNFYPEAQEFLILIQNQKRNDATQYILNLIENKYTIKDIYLNIFQPTLYHIGFLWQTNQISVAEEHYYTAIIQSIIGLLYPYWLNVKHPMNKRLLAYCVSDELHEIGIRMVADFFEMEGWDTFYYGGNTPIATVFKEIKRLNPDLIAISATTSLNLQNVIEQIKMIKSQTNAKILVGGRLFNESPDLWKEIGADGMAKSADVAIKIAERLVNNESFND